LIHLLVLHLDSNELSGEIPTFHSDYLLSLDLSNNTLSGEIPSQLGYLYALQSLNVSHNQLSGKIPSSFNTGMVSLRNSSIDFSYNNLTGPIPTSTAFEDAPAEAYVGNPGLCGHAEGLTPCSPDSRKKKHSNTNITLLVVMIPVCGVLQLAIIVAGLVICYRKTKLLDEESRAILECEQKVESLIWGRECKFTFRDIVKATGNFHEEYCIGKGGFGSVYKAALPTGQIVAVKRFNLSDSGDIQAASLKSFENEIRMLTEVRHRNIIKLYGFRSIRGCTYLVYEYVEKGSLGNVLHGVEGKAELDWGRRLKIVQGVAHAIAYLHHDCSSPIVHRDITVNNILLELEFEPRLSDFGIARLLSSDTTTVAGTYGCMAPGKLITI
jgi:hypothetical protein